MNKKVYLLSVYISVHKFDIICLLQTYLNSESSSDYRSLVTILLDTITHLTLYVGTWFQPPLYKGGLTFSNLSVRVGMKYSF